MTPPNRLPYRDFEYAKGGLREDYFVEAMKQAGIRFYYLKTMKFLKYFNSAMRVISIVLDWSKALQDREVTAYEGLDLVKRVCGAFNLPLRIKF